VRKAGAWYTYEGDQLGQGKENARKYLKDNPGLTTDLERMIKEKLGVGVAKADLSVVPAVSAEVELDEDFDDED
jgi:recombination protein RecA